MPRRSNSAAIVGVLTVAAPALAGNAPHIDAYGVAWRQLQGTTGLTWEQIAAVCPTDGQSPCEGTINGVDVTGWVWASQEQVRKMFAEFVPELEEVPEVEGAQYVLPALGFCDGAFSPTWSFYTTFGGYLFVGGWTSTLNGDGTAVRASASAQYPVFYGSFSVLGAAATMAASQEIGVWLHDHAIEAPCPADVNGDGVVDFADLNMILADFGTTAPGLAGDVDGDGDVDFADINAALGVFQTAC